MSEESRHIHHNMGIPPKPKAFSHSLRNALESTEGQLVLLVVMASLAVRIVAPQVFVPATFLLVGVGYLSSGILNRIRDYQVGAPHYRARMKGSLTSVSRMTTL